MRKKLTRLIKKLCIDFNADYEMVDQKTRKGEIIKVRHIIYYYLREETNLSWGDIGAVFGQDHSNALIAHKSISNLFDTLDKKFLEWFRVNDIQVRQMIDIAVNGSNYLIRKKYRHYELIEMVVNFFGEEEAIRFEKHMINETIKKNGELQ